jgi:methylase of polypeptide subunit release factors
VVTGDDWSIPSWVTPPWVLKPAFEHMSRGLRLVRSEQEGRVLAAALRERFHQPLLIETFLPGRELAVPVLAGAGGPGVLPVVEMRAADRPGVLTEEFKRVEFHGVREDAAPADLATREQEHLEELACKAFETLGLRDYARFDVRLSPGGVFYFLEANATPSMEPFEAFALSARWAGLEYPAVIERMLASALHRYGGLPASKTFEIPLPTGIVEIEAPVGVHIPPDSSAELARLLDVQEGEDVLELGCGCGLISIAAAKRGARRVVATDLDPAALAATETNARRNGVADRIQIRAGSWYEALKPEGGKGPAERFQVVIATPPQTPGPVHFGPKYGGREGTRHLFAAVDGAAAFLDPGRGRLWLLTVSLADPKALWERLGERFEEVALAKETPRLFTREEYDALQPGLFDHLLALREAGRSDFEEAKGGVYRFRNLLIRARRPRPS